MNSRTTVLQLPTPLNATCHVMVTPLKFAVPAIGSVSTTTATSLHQAHLLSLLIRIGLPRAATRKYPVVLALYLVLTISSDNVVTRSLSLQLYIDNLTVEKCLNACSARNYEYAGMEYGQECCEC
jgi:hypothetical protein